MRGGTETSTPLPLACGKYFIPVLGAGNIAVDKRGQEVWLHGQKWTALVFLATDTASAGNPYLQGE